LNSRAIGVTTIVNELNHREQDENPNRSRFEFVVLFFHVFFVIFFPNTNVHLPQSKSKKDTKIKKNKTALSEDFERSEKFQEELQVRLDFASHSGNF
jgi:hypothetical protein